MRWPCARVSWELGVVYIAVLKVLVCAKLGFWGGVWVVVAVVIADARQLVGRWWIARDCGTSSSVLISRGSGVIWSMVGSRFKGTPPVSPRKGSTAVVGLLAGD